MKTKDEKQRMAENLRRLAEFVRSDECDVVEAEAISSEIPGYDFLTINFTFSTALPNLWELFI